MSFEQPPISAPEEEMTEKEKQEREKEAAELMGDTESFESKENVEKEAEAAFKFLSNEKWKDKKDISEEEADELVENYDLMTRSHKYDPMEPHYAKIILLKNPETRRKIVDIYIKNGIPDLDEGKKMAEEKNDTFNKRADENIKNLLGGAEVLEALWQALRFAGSLKFNNDAEASAKIYKSIGETLLETMKEMRGRGCALIDDSGVDLLNLIKRIGEHASESGINMEEIINEAKRMSNELVDEDEKVGLVGTRGRDALRKLEQISKYLEKK